MYIAARIEKAGGDPGRLFSRDAVIAIYEYSSGIPRTINVICDNALVTGFAEEQRTVGAEIIHGVCQDFDLHPGRRDVTGPRPMQSQPTAETAEMSSGSRSPIGHAFSSAAAAGRRALKLRSS
jgi:hypothetical protein